MPLSNPRKKLASLKHLNQQLQKSQQKGKGQHAGTVVGTYAFNVMDQAGQVCLVTIIVSMDANGDIYADSNVASGAGRVGVDLADENP